MPLRQTRQQPTSIGLVATPDAHEDEDGDSSGDWHSTTSLVSAGKQRALKRRSCLLMFKEVLRSESKQAACYSQSICLSQRQTSSTRSAGSPYDFITRTSSPLLLQPQDHHLLV